VMVAEGQIRALAVSLLPRSLSLSLSLSLSSQSCNTVSMQVDSVWAIGDVTNRMALTPGTLCAAACC
jgi:hypothetical protein